jgi:hypothetical protein
MCVILCGFVSFVHIFTSSFVLAQQNNEKRRRSDDAAARGEKKPYLKKFLAINTG